MSAIKVSTGPSPSESSRGEPFLASSSFPCLQAILGVPQPVDATVQSLLHLHMPFSPVSVSKFLCSQKDTSLIGLDIQYSLI